jgi:hypothetical protein
MGMGTLLDGPVAQTVPGQVADDSIKETDRVALGLEAGACLPEAEERLLHRVPGVFPRAEGAGGVAYQAANLTVEQLAEGVHVSRRDPGPKCHGAALIGRCRRLSKGGQIKLPQPEEIGATLRAGKSFYPPVSTDPHLAVT